MSIFQKNILPSKGWDSGKVATLKTHQRLGFRTVLDITRTPYDSFPRNLGVSYSNFETLLAVDVQKLARMLFFPDSSWKKLSGVCFQNIFFPPRVEIHGISKDLAPELRSGPKNSGNRLETEFRYIYIYIYSDRSRGVKHQYLIKNLDFRDFWVSQISPPLTPIALRRAYLYTLKGGVCLLSRVARGLTKEPRT